MSGFGRLIALLLRPVWQRWWFWFTLWADMKNILRFVFLCLALIPAGCGDIPTCLDQESSLVKINFLDAAGKAKKITLVRLSAINNPDGFPEYADSTLNAMHLPLNPADKVSTFILEQSGRTDTLGLSYSVTAKLISPECGLDAAFDNLDTTHTTFEQLNIIQRTIHKDVEVNLEIIL